MQNLLKRGLANKALMIVIVPLLFQCLLVAILLNLLAALQVEIDVGTHCRDAILSTHRLMLAVGDSGLILNPADGSDPDPRLGAEVIRKISSCIQEMAAAVSSDPELHPQMVSVVADAKGVAAVIQKAAKMNFSRVAVGHSLGKYREVMLRQIMNRTIANTDAVVNVEEEKRKESAKRAQSIQDEIGLILWLALPTGVLLAAVLGWDYAMTIRKPLQRITENSKLLGKGLPLLPKLKGSDELCEFDRMFHAVSDAVKEVQEEEQLLILRAADLICSLDRNGNFLAANDSSRRLLGVGSNDLCGRNMIDLAVLGEKDKADNELTAACYSSVTRNFNLTLLSSRGTTVETSWSAFWSERQKALFCVVHDVTERNRAAQLKRDFVEMISSDLRAPLSSMIKSVEWIIDEDKPKTSGQKEELTLAQRNLNRLSGFVDDLLNFQQMQSDKIQIDRKECSVQEILQTAADMIRASAAAKNVTVVLASASVSGAIVGDISKLTQALLNFISNAVRFSPNGGTVQIDAREINDEIEFTVTDSGPGVPEEHRSNIFEAFTQVPNSPHKKQGSGLGLSIVKLIVEGHGGTLGVRTPSTQNSGSTFWFRLPKLKID